MTRRKTVKTKDTRPMTLKARVPEISEAAEYHRQKVEGILRRQQSLDSAKELLGWDIVAATEDGVKRVRIAKTRSFDGLSKSTTNRDGIEMEAGHVYIMKHRVAKFLNITTGREGRQTCVWIEEAIDLENGKMLKSNQLLRSLGLLESDGEPIFTKRTAIVPGVALKEEDIERLSPSASGASANTTAIFQAHFSKEDRLLEELQSAVETYNQK